MAFATLWRRRVRGLENVPRRGPLLLAANHASLADPPLVGSSLLRPLYFMAKEELFRIPLFSWVLRQVNAFPIKRKGGDLGALRTAQNILAAGGAMIVFPEGTRQRGGVLGQPKAGVGLLALRSKAPVVPVYVHNSHRVPAFPKLEVIFGPPLQAAEGESAEAFSLRAMDAIRALKETAG
jgi:1-acyl-sn-glycerol-3-phosphate acyltransferase